MFAWFHCWMRRHHKPVRHPLGGFRCADCGTMGIDLREMGFKELGYVGKDHKRFARDEYSGWAR